MMLLGLMMVGLLTGIRGLPNATCVDDPEGACQTCNQTVYYCGERAFDEQAYCNAVAGTSGINGAPCPTGPTFCTLAENNTVLNYSTACVLYFGSRECFFENYDGFRQDAQQANADCLDDTDQNGQCCNECDSAECFCPVMNCQETGAVNPVVETFKLPKNGSKWCYEDCLCCYTEACCQSDTCRPSTFAAQPDTDCCLLDTCPNAGGSSSTSAVTDGAGSALDSFWWPLKQIV